MQMEHRPRRAVVRAALRRGFVAVGALLICPGCATLRAESEVLTPEHLIKLRRVASAQISPDGQHIAYVLEVPRTPFKDEDGRPWMELHVADQQGGTRPFVTGEVSVGGVAWKPDGSAISFTDKRGKDKHRALYAIPLDGGEARRIVQHGDDIGAYSWSPDGRRVAFVAKEPEPKAKKELKEKGFKAEIDEEDWQPAKV